MPKVTPIAKPCTACDVFLSKELAHAKTKGGTLRFNLVALKKNVRLALLWASLVVLAASTGAGTAAAQNSKGTGAGASGAEATLQQFPLATPQGAGQTTTKTVEAAETTFPLATPLPAASSENTPLAPLAKPEAVSLENPAAGAKKPANEATEAAPTANSSTTQGGKPTPSSSWLSRWWSLLLLVFANVMLLVILWFLFKNRQSKPKEPEQQDPPSGNSLSETVTNSPSAAHKFEKKSKRLDPKEVTTPKSTLQLGVGEGSIASDTAPTKSSDSLSVRASQSLALQATDPPATLDASQVILTADFNQSPSQYTLPRASVASPQTMNSLASDTFSNPAFSSAMNSVESASSPPTPNPTSSLAAFDLQGQTLPNPTLGSMPRVDSPGSPKLASEPSFFENHSQIFDDSHSAFSAEVQEDEAKLARSALRAEDSNELQKAHSYTKLGNLYLQEKNYDRALEMFNQVIRQFRQHAEPELVERVVFASLHRAVVLEQTGQLHEALDHLEVLTASYSRNSPAPQILSHIVTAKLRTAQLYVRLQLRHKALRVVQGVIKTYSNTDDVQIQQLIGRAHTMLGKLRPENN